LISGDRRSPFEGRPLDRLEYVVTQFVAIECATTRSYQQLHHDALSALHCICAAVLDCEDVGCERDDIVGVLEPVTADPQPFAVRAAIAVVAARLSERLRNGRVHPSRGERGAGVGDRAALRGVLAQLSDRAAAPQQDPASGERAGVPHDASGAPPDRRLTLRMRDGRGS
jgi:hypothetical protein